MKNIMLSVVLMLPLFISTGTYEPVDHLKIPARKFTCSPETTGSWTITYSQSNPFPCGTITVTASYNNGSCPAPGDIVVTPGLTSGVGVSPSPLVGSIPSGVSSFVVGNMTFSNYVMPPGPRFVKLTVTATGGHTITNPIIKCEADTCY